MTLPDRVLDAGRFGTRAKWLLVGALVLLWASARYVAIPEIWSLLDRAEVLGAAATSGAPSAEAGDGAYTRVYTAAYTVSVAPAVTGVVLYLLWRVRHTVEERFPTPVLLVLAALVTCQVASVAAGWGDPYTGSALEEQLEGTGISLWARGAVERGWYAGYAGLVLGAAALAFAFTRPPRHQPRWILALVPVAVAAPWAALAGPYF
ncbi:hypothetical protein ACFYQA_11570 [Streptomyces sp. NPDC005774]|uniref:hypothetical protein n=1 Tax=Streptomyces sp. NPDC005774 TaxID=3364728 RepID=UPI0036C77A65